MSAIALSRARKQEELAALKGLTGRARVAMKKQFEAGHIPTKEAEEIAHISSSSVSALLPIMKIGTPETTSPKLDPMEKKKKAAEIFARIKKEREEAPQAQPVESERGAVQANPYLTAEENAEIEEQRLAEENAEAERKKGQLAVREEIRRERELFQERNRRYLAGIGPTPEELIEYQKEIDAEEIEQAAYLAEQKRIADEKAEAKAEKKRIERARVEKVYADAKAIERAKEAAERALQPVLTAEQKAELIRHREKRAAQDEASRLANSRLVNRLIIAEREKKEKKARAKLNTMLAAIPEGVDYLTHRNKVMKRKEFNILRED